MWARTLLFLSILMVVVTLPRGLAQTPPPQNATPQTPAAGNASPQAPTGPVGTLGRKGPPQPQLKQTLDYFVGTWSATWSGRESALSPGPRSGTVTYTRLPNSNFLEIRGEGKTEDGKAYKETGTVGWHEGQKILALHEKSVSGVDVLSIGDWTSPISIRFESAPIATKTQTIIVRRTYGIVSPGSFTVTEEQSTDGKTFTRIGIGLFGKK
jgi:hypothetical protein